MMKKNISLVLSAFVLAFAVQANAADFSVLGGLDMAKTSVSPETTGVTYGGISKFTFGADYHHSFAPNWGLEVGLFYQNKGGKLTQNVAGVDIETSGVMHALTVPVMVRYTVLPQYLSVGAGLFASYGIGDVSTTVGTGAATTQTYDQAGYGKFDFGVVGGVRGSYPVAQGIEVIGDVRYYYGLKNISTATSLTQKTTDLALLVGARFAL